MLELIFNFLFSVSQSVRSFYCCVELHPERLLTLKMFCVNTRQTGQKRLRPACPKRLQRWSLWRSKSNAWKGFLLSSLPIGVLPLSYPAALSSPPPPPPHPSLTPSLSEWVALGLLGLVEVYQKHVWRVGGGWWEVLRPSPSFPPSPCRKPKLVGKKSS